MGHEVDKIIDWLDPNAYLITNHKPEAIKDLTGVNQLCDWLIHASYVFEDLGFMVKEDTGTHPQSYSNIINVPS